MIKVTRVVFWGWPWFGLGRIRFHFPPTDYLTMWVLCITRRFAIGVHVGGVPCEEDSDG